MSIMAAVDFHGGLLLVPGYSLNFFVAAQLSVPQVRSNPGIIALIDLILTAVVHALQGSALDTFEHEQSIS